MTRRCSRGAAEVRPATLTSWAGVRLAAPRTVLLLLLLLLSCFHARAQPRGVLLVARSAAVRVPRPGLCHTPVSCDCSGSLAVSGVPFNNQHLTHGPKGIRFSSGRTTILYTAGVPERCPGIASQTKIDHVTVPARGNDPSHCTRAQLALFHSDSVRGPYFTVKGTGRVALIARQAF